jgi:hypothetical protein
MSIIEVQNGHHLGDNIINFIFFYKIKNYIEENNITIHYYCSNQYHKNLLDFKCSENIKILDFEHKGYVLWQGGSTPDQHYIEDKLCGMFNIFLKHHNIPISVNSFEYQDQDLLNRHKLLDNKYKNIDILIINSKPLSSQYNYNKPVWDNFIVKLSSKYTLATTEKVNDSIISLADFSVKNIAAIALNVKKIIAINTGPSIPLYNTNILDNVETIYLFTSAGSNFKTRKVQTIINIEELSFLYK